MLFRRCDSTGGSAKAQAFPDQTIASSLCRITARRKALDGVPEYGVNLISCYTGKPEQEVVDRGAALQVFEKRHHWYASIFEEPCAADLLGISLYRRACGPIHHKRTLLPLVGRPQDVTSAPIGVKKNKSLHRPRRREHGEYAREDAFALF